MLVARCPNCSAKFRVTPDTLNARQGKVRCGECQNVFNAFQTLSREPDPPAQTALTATPATRLAEATSAPAPSAATPTLSPAKPAPPLVPTPAAIMPTSAVAAPPNAPPGNSVVGNIPPPPPAPAPATLPDTAAAPPATAASLDPPPSATPTVSAPVDRTRNTTPARSVTPLADWVAASADGTANVQPLVRDSPRRPDQTITVRLSTLPEVEPVIPPLLDPHPKPAPVTPPHATERPRDEARGVPEPDVSTTPPGGTPPSAAALSDRTARDVDVSTATTRTLGNLVASTQLPTLTPSPQQTAASLAAAGSRTGSFAKYVPPTTTARAPEVPPPTAQPTPLATAAVSPREPAAAQPDVPTLPPRATSKLLAKEDFVASPPDREQWIEEHVDDAPVGSDQASEIVANLDTSLLNEPARAALPPMHAPAPELAHSPPTSRSALWIFGSIVLLLLGVAQAVYLFRADIAQRYPEYRPWLEAVCEPLACTIPWRNDVKALDLVVNEFREDPRERGRFLLSATLRHRGSSTQELPHLTIKLTNNSNLAVVQRHLKPAEYLGRPLAAGETLKPGATLVLQLKLEAAKVGATGYELDVMYPATE